MKVLSEQALEKFKDWLLENQKTTNPFPDFLSDDSEGVSLNVKLTNDIKKCNSLAKLGPLLFEFINKNKFEIEKVKPELFWASLSLHLKDLILPKGYKVLEYRRYVFSDGRNIYKHLIYSSYLVYKSFGEDGQVILQKYNHTHETFADKFLGRKDSYQSSDMFELVKKLYLNGKNKSLCSTDKKGNLNRLMKYIRQISVNYNLSGMSIDEVIELLPPQFDDVKKDV